MLALISKFFMLVMLFSALYSFDSLIIFEPPHKRGRKLLGSSRQPEADLPL